MAHPGLPLAAHLFSPLFHQIQQAVCASRRSSKQQPQHLGRASLAATFFWISSSPCASTSAAEQRPLHHTRSKPAPLSSLLQQQAEPNQQDSRPAVRLPLPRQHLDLLLNEHISPGTAAEQRTPLSLAAWRNDSAHDSLSFSLAGRAAADPARGSGSRQH